MTSSLARAGVLFAALALAGCNGSFEDIAPKAERQLPVEIVNSMKAKGMSKGSPIMMRIFKEEGELEVWKQKDTGRYDLIASYEICKWSGKLGPKFTEGDRQAPEGFYTIHPAQMNPRSSYHLAFNIGFPNVYDQVNGRTGRHLMVHGACSSAGCYSMTDEQVEHIYAFARDAFRGGQTAFQLQAFPFRMTAENMARYRNDRNYAFWKMLKEGYDHFEITKQPPKVDVCDRRYVFNRIPEGEHVFNPAAACPPMTQPESLRMAYQAYQSKFDTAFAEAVGGKPKNQPKPTIAGPKEAVLVADWSKRRARGERVSREPPSLEAVATASAEPTEISTQTMSAYTTASLPAPAPRPATADANPAASAQREPAAQSARVQPAPAPEAPEQPAQTASAEATAVQAAPAPEAAPEPEAQKLGRPKSMLARLRNLLGD